jgi:hypothetical protein
MERFEVGAILENGLSSLLERNSCEHMGRFWFFFLLSQTNVRKRDGLIERWVDCDENLALCLELGSHE